MRPLFKNLNPDRRAGTYWSLFAYPVGRSTIQLARPRTLNITSHTFGKKTDPNTTRHCSLPD